MPRQTRRLSAKRPRNPKILGEKGEGNPTVGSFSKRNSSRPVIARASISFSETKSMTSWPRARRTSATARPGNKWPPVPPQAITVFIGFSNLGFRISKAKTKRVSWKDQSKIEDRKSKIRSYPRRRPRPDHRALFLRRLEHTLAVDV